MYNRYQTLISAYESTYSLGMTMMTLLVEP